MNCKTGMSQYLVETIISAKILEMLGNGTVQAGLKACESTCDTYLGKGTEVVTCNSFSDMLCQAIEEGNTCLPFIDAFLLTGTVLTITAGDQTFPVDLAPLFADFTAVEVDSFAFTSPSSNVLRLQQTDGTAFDVDLNYLVTDASDIADIVTNNTAVRNTIAALFKQCSGTAHVPGNSIPTCQEMVTAINTAITTAIGGIAADKFLSVASYNSDTNELTLVVNGGSTFVIPLTDLVDSVFVSTDAGNRIVNGTDGGIYVAPAAAIPNASTTLAGVTEYATTTEAVAGTSASLAVTPAGLAAALAAKPALPIQGGSVVNNKQKDLSITFNPPVQNPTFIITNMYNKNNYYSDISYTNLTNTGVTVKRGYSTTAGGLQDFSWVALSLT